MEERIKDIIVEQLGVNIKEVIPSARLMEDLNADSLDVIELTMVLEEEFGIEISNEEAEKLWTVGEVIEFIKNKKA